MSDDDAKQKFVDNYLETFVFPGLYDQTGGRAAAESSAHPLSAITASDLLRPRDRIKGYVPIKDQRIAEVGHLSYHFHIRMTCGCRGMR